MCESCSSNGMDRREFLAAAGLIGAAGFISAAKADEAKAALTLPLPKREQTPAKVQVAFLYPPADVVNAGKNEDGWAKHNWFTWPGNQFEYEAQERKFVEKITEMARKLGIDVRFEPQAIYQAAKVKEFIERTKAAGPDAVLIVNFYNSFSPWSYQMATESAPTAIVYHALGANHQLPPAKLREAEGLYYIHSMENWAEIERGLRAVRARKMLAQSRLLRISGRTPTPPRMLEKQLGVDVIEVPAAEFNDLFDSISADDAIKREAMEIKQHATRVMDVEDQYFIDAIRAHRSVDGMLERYGADAITIECLMLKHRKPCISFAAHNGELVPAGCENDLNATLTLMLGRWLFDRGGFQHNPEFDTSENRYYSSHCTCAWKLHGPQGPSQAYLVRPFFHQLPKTPALDVQWTPGEPIIMAKYHSDLEKLCCWTGKVIESPTTPPTGGCATRVLMDIDKVDDVCTIYPGPHPVLFCADRGDARCMRAFAKMYRLPFEGNV